MDVDPQPVARPAQDTAEPAEEKMTAQADLFQYEAQHYGFTPTSLINGMFNSVCDFYREALKAFSKACSEKFPNMLTDEELQAARHGAGENIDRDISTVFDALEHYLLANVFAIPESAVLREDLCQLSRSSPAEEAGVQARIDEVKKRIIAVKYANAKLSQHLETTSAMQASVDEILNKVTSTDSNICNMNAEGIADWISYQSEQMTKAVQQ